MNGNWLSTVFGSTVLVVASMFVILHYFREHRRARRLRALDPVRRHFRF
jgi:hypothetical protein